MTTPRRTKLLISAVLAALVLTGCGDGVLSFTSEEDRLEEKLAGLPGVASATVDYETLDFDYHVATAEVRMDDDASAAEIAEVLETLRGQEIDVESEGLERTEPVTGVVELTREGGEGSAWITTMDGKVDSAERLVDLALRMDQVLPAADLRLSESKSHGLGLMVSLEDEEQISETATSMAGDDLLADAGEVTVGSGDRLDPITPHGLVLHGADGMTHELAAEWERVYGVLAATTDGPVDDRYDVTLNRGREHSANTEIRAWDREVEEVPEHPTDGLVAQQLSATIGGLLDVLDAADPNAELTYFAGPGALVSITTDGTKPSHHDEPAWHQAAEERLVR